MKETNNKNSSYIIIAGCGRVGANLANTLSASGKNVTVIDQNPESFDRLSPSFDGIATIGNVTEIQVLTDAAIDKATAVISVTDNDNTNIMIAQMAKELFGIKEVIARLYDPERECVYREFGIDTICPATLSAKEIDRLLGIPEEEDQTI